MRSRRRLAGVLVLACAAGLAAGCTPGGAADPGVSPSVSGAVSPSPSPEPSVDPVETAKAENIAEAEALVRAYFDAYNAVGADGGKDWGPRLLPFLDSEKRISITTQWWTQIAEQGQVYTGGTLLESFTVTDYVGDPGDPNQTQTVIADVCLDNSELEIVDPSGKVVSYQQGDPRSILEVVVHRTAGKDWFLNDMASSGKAC